MAGGRCLRALRVFMGVVSDRGQRDAAREFLVAVSNPLHQIVSVGGCSCFEGVSAYSAMCRG